jgi:hypothetical protein
VKSDIHNQGDKIMNRTFLKVILVFVLLVAIASLGIFAYRAGLSQGMAQSALLNTGAAPAPAYPYYGMYYGFPFFGMLSCLVPLFLLFVAFVALRGLFWQGRGGWGRMHHGPWGHYPMGGRPDWKEGVPPMVEEWHRKMHEGSASHSDMQTGPESV